MNTEFTLLDKTFSLIRYPAKHQHVSLQAWDSADELLIEYAMEQGLDQQTKTVILNDDFGALGSWFAACKQTPTWVSDSYISYRSLQENLTLNDLSPLVSDGFVVHPVKAQDSMASLPQAPDVVLIKIPRAMALLEQQLIELAKVVTPATKVIGAAKVKSITNNVLALFEKYLGSTKTSLAKKKSRLIFTECDAKAERVSPYPTCWNTKLPSGKEVTLVNHANVFSRQSLDIGARLMLEHMQVAANEHVVDLGCGNGILGLQALNLAPDCKVTFVDESYMALASARDSVKANFPDALDNCRFIASNCLETLLREHPLPTVSKVLCNPPFHQQNTITDHIAWQMFNDSKDILTKGGHLVVVGNRHLDYHTKLKRIFGGVKLLASNRKFVILGAAKR